MILEATRCCGYPEDSSPTALFQWRILTLATVVLMVFSSAVALFASIAACMTDVKCIRPCLRKCGCVCDPRVAGYETVVNSESIYYEYTSRATNHPGYKMFCTSDRRFRSVLVSSEAAPSLET